MVDALRPMPEALAPGFEWRLGLWQLDGAASLLGGKNYG
jgi:hypothetical protein